MIEKARQLLEDVKIALMRSRPFYYFLLNTMRVQYVDDMGMQRYYCTQCNFFHEPDTSIGIEHSQFASGSVKSSICVGGNTIKIYKDFFHNEELVRNAPQIFIHELFHVVLLHSVRAGEIYETLKMRGSSINRSDLLFLCNLAMDAKVEFLINKDAINYTSNKFREPLFAYTTSEIEKESVEELVLKRLTYSNDMQPIGCDLGEVMAGQSQGQQDKAVVELQHGDERIVQGQDLEDGIKRCIMESLIKTKMSGIGQGAVLRQLEDELLKSRPLPWHILLRNLIKSGIIRYKVTDWGVLNRKLPYLMPGMRTISKPRVKVCIDLSGSITPSEYSLFCKELLAIARIADVEAIFWDDGIRWRRKVRLRADLKTRYGGGGTRFAPVLTELRTDLRQDDVLVVLTDGYLYDAREVEEMMRRIHSPTILVTTDRKLNNFDHIIEIRPKGR